MRERTLSQGRYRLQAIAGVLMGLWLSACGSADINRANSGNGKPNVVTTSTVINDWAQQVGGTKFN